MIYLDFCLITFFSWEGCCADEIDWNSNLCTNGYSKLKSLHKAYPHLDGAKRNLVRRGKNTSRIAYNIFR